MNVFFILLNMWLSMHVCIEIIHYVHAITQTKSLHVNFVWNKFHMKFSWWISHTGILPVYMLLICMLLCCCLIQIGAAKGRLKNFVIEPFIKHEQVCRHCFRKTWYPKKAEFIIFIYFETSSSSHTELLCDAENDNFVHVLIY